MSGNCWRLVKKATSAPRQPLCRRSPAYRRAGGGVTNARRAAAVLLSGGHAGVSADGPIHGSRYPHVAIGTNICAVSDGLFHPLPQFTLTLDAPLPLALAVTVGAGSVTSEPVGVYCGAVATSATFVSDSGGQGKDARNVCGTSPAPAPPVCHACSGGLNGSLFSHTPSERRGSVGIQPSCSPSWYDHAGASGRPETVELPIFHVQKNQFCGKDKPFSITVRETQPQMKTLTWRADMLCSANCCMAAFHSSSYVV